MHVLCYNYHIEHDQTTSHEQFSSVKFMFKERNMATASRYVFTGSALPENSNKGQLELCVRHLRILGSATAEELAQAIKPELKTVQTPERIAAYYLCVLKKAGSVR